MSEQINNELTKSGYAEYKGVSKPMVSKWYKDGRLVMTPDDRFVLVSESDARIKLTASLNNSFYDQKAGDERKKINKIIEEKGFEGLTEEVNSHQLDLETKDVDELFKNARAMKEKSLALQAEVDHKKAIGELVERDSVDKIIFERARQFRDGLMTWKRRIAPELVGKDNIHEIEDLLERDIRFLLNEFSKMPVIE